MLDSKSVQREIDRLQYTDPYKFADAVDKVLMHMPLEKGLARKLADQVEERLLGQGALPAVTLAKVIAESRSLTLYRSVKKQLFRDENASLVLYESGFADARIEQVLLNAVWERAKQQRWGGGQLLKALGNRGSQDAVGSLESLVDYLRDDNSTKQVVARAAQDSGVITDEAFLAGLMAQTSAEFIQQVRCALDALRARGALATDFRDDVIAIGDRRYVLPDGFLEHYRAAKENINEPKDSIGEVRKAIEAMARHSRATLKEEGLLEGREPQNLGELIRQLKNSEQLPELLTGCFSACQHIGNVAHHPPKDPLDVLTERLRDALLAIMEESRRIFEDWAERRRSQWERSLEG